MKLRSTHVRLAVAIAFVLAYAPSALAITANVNDISIKWREVCGEAAADLNLGNMSVSLTDFDASSALMEATFTVSAAAKSTNIFNWMELHWLQMITQDADPPDYKGSPSTNPIIDPPQGGWDYMFSGGVHGGTPLAGYELLIDDEPWYFNSTETTFHAEGVTYTILDIPAKFAEPGLDFTTFIVATAKPHTCTDADCLDPNEILLLGGFEWHESTTSLNISGFASPTTTHVAQFTSALANASFDGWSVFSDKVVCCTPVPEPASFPMVTLGLLVIGACARHRRRHRRA